MTCRMQALTSTASQLWFSAIVVKMRHHRMLLNSGPWYGCLDARSDQSTSLSFADVYRHGFQDIPAVSYSGSSRLSYFIQTTEIRRDRDEKGPVV